MYAAVSNKLSVVNGTDQFSSAVAMSGANAARVELTIFANSAHPPITGSCAAVRIPAWRRTRRRKDVSFSSRKTICLFARLSRGLDPSSASS